jgi:hypothetical protein
MTSAVALLRAVRPVRLTAISRLPAVASSRLNATGAPKHVASAAASDAQPTDVAPLPPPPHVVEADIVSGAPGRFEACHPRVHVFADFSTDAGQPHFVTALCAFISRHATLCKVAEQRERNGGSTLIRSLGAVDGKTR